ncbi:MAG TPA: hypothetical protein VGW58_03480 [Pyrinomonadaceae bacterium]|nr:hypothetical protein [Pyrinomonadaceae bacterium]
MVLPISVLSLITSTFETLKIRYVLVGSFASSMYGLYRATADIDILADIRAEHVGPLHEALKEAFYVDELAMRNAIARRQSFNAIHYDSVFKVDLFVASDDAFATAQLERRQLRKLSPDLTEEVYVATAEDTVLAKLRWFRAGNESSQNQWNDVLGILAVLKGGLDTTYLRRWAERLDVTDLLQRALDEVRAQGL